MGHDGTGFGSYFSTSDSIAKDVQNCAELLERDCATVPWTLPRRISEGSNEAW